MRGSVSQAWGTLLFTLLLSSAGRTILITAWFRSAMGITGRRRASVDAIKQAGCGLPGKRIGIRFQRCGNPGRQPLGWIPYPEVAWNFFDWIIGGIVPVPPSPKLTPGNSKATDTLVLTPDPVLKQSELAEELFFATTSRLVQIKRRLSNPTRGR